VGLNFQEAAAVLESRMGVMPTTSDMKICSSLWGYAHVAWTAKGLFTLWMK
jgi:hypothetical protein